MKDIIPADRPHSIEAEQQVLGALLSNNDLFDRLSGYLAPDHFFDPVHARIFDAASDRIARGEVADMRTLWVAMQADEGLGELGGKGYLASLVGYSSSAYAIRDYAKIIRECATRRDLAQIGEEITARSMVPDADPAAQVEAAEAALFKLGEESTTGRGAVTFLASATEAVRQAVAAFERGDGLAGLSTGFFDLDSHTGGLMDSNLIILAGRPAMGKTSLAMNIATNVAKAYDAEAGTGGAVGVFSMEMSHEQLSDRILSGESGVASSAIKRGNVTRDDLAKYAAAGKRLESLPLVIDDTPALHIAQLASRARRMKRVHGIRLLVVDYIQLMRGDADNRVIEIGQISMGLKAIAKDLNIPVIALSQLSRGVESRPDKRPMLSDLRDSGSIEQDADVVAFVYREEVYRQKELGDPNDDGFADRMLALQRCEGKAEVIIGKDRHGPIGTVEMSFEGQFTRFGNLPKSEWSNQ